MTEDDADTLLTQLKIAERGGTLLIDAAKFIVTEMSISQSIRITLRDTLYDLAALQIEIADQLRSQVISALILQKESV